MTGVAFDPRDLGAEDDRRWFAAHPDRQHRIRPYLPGDCSLDRPMPALPRGCSWVTVVRQEQPGVRLRLTWQTAVPLRDGSERNAAFFFQVVAGLS
jgi:hypothetical protein